MDIIIIGAGVTGTAIARELSRDNREILVLEKASDVCEGTSKSNSGIVHAGHDALTGTLKAKLNVWGNRLMGEFSEELDFPFIRNGAFVLNYSKNEKQGLYTLLERGKQNGVEDLFIIDREEVKKIEPGIADDVTSALYVKNSGIVCPFTMNIAMAENACVNGVHFSFDTRVIKIEKPINGRCFKVYTDKGCFEAPMVINSAGVFADKIHEMVSKETFLITPRRGEYCLFDKEVGNIISHTLFQLPGKMGKGVLVTPTVHGNLLIGPTAEDLSDREAVNTTKTGMDLVLEQAKRSINSVPVKSIITSFAGLRAHGDYRNQDGNLDFMIKEASDAPGFIDVAGIESPGLSCAPAIGKYVYDMVRQIMKAPANDHFNGRRKGVRSMAMASPEEKRKLIMENPAYANVICRCEQITEGEILDAIHRPLGASTVDGIKRRTRAGMGRCQAGFCLPKTIDILARELKVDASNITKCGGSSFYIK